MQQEDLVQLIEAAVKGGFLSEDDRAEALEVFKGSSDPQEFVQILFSQVVPFGQQEAIIRMFIGNEGLRKILLPEVHLQFLKYILGSIMGFTEEQELGVLEKNIRKAIKDSAGLPLAVEAAARSSFKELTSYDL